MTVHSDTELVFEVSQIAPGAEFGKKLRFEQQVSQMRQFLKSSGFRDYSSLFRFFYLFIYSFLYLED